MKKSSHLAVVTNLNPQTVGPVLTPAAAARLLKNCSDPLATLSLALQLFGGLHPAEVETLKWRSFAVEGYVDTFHVHNQNSIPIQCIRSVQVLAVLDAWLEPFTLRTDKLCFNESVRHHAAETLREAGIENPATLRHTYLAYALAQISRVWDWAQYCNIDLEEIQDRLFPSICAEDVRRMRTLTPKKVGIKDWPERVASALKGQALERTSPSQR
jgi:integrase